MKKYRWGIIGTGRIAHTFAQALVGCEDAELYAVASRTKEKAQRFAGEFSAQAAYGSYEELAADEKVDVVYIATPMSSHYSDTMLCLRHGRNVLCEKSAAMNTGELEEMIAFAKSKGLFFMEAMWMKCRPAYLKALEWVRSGRIGKVEYIKADFCNIVKYDANDRLFAPSCGGGAMLDLAVYPLTLVRDFMGEPDKVESFAHMSRGVDMSNTFILKKGDAYACVNSGFEIPNNNNAVISGSQGLVLFNDWFFCTDTVTLHDHDGVEIQRSVTPNEINGYEFEVREVHRCLENGLLESTLVPHESTLGVMKLMTESGII